MLIITKQLNIQSRQNFMPIKPHFRDLGITFRCNSVLPALTLICVGCTLSVIYLATLIYALFGTTIPTYFCTCNRVTVESREYQCT